MNNIQENVMNWNDSQLRDLLAKKDEEIAKLKKQLSELQKKLDHSPK